MIDNIFMVFFVMWSQAYFIALPVMFYRQFKGTYYEKPLGILLWSGGIGFVGFLGVMFVLPFFMALEEVGW